MEDGWVNKSANFGTLVRALVGPLVYDPATMPVVLWGNGGRIDSEVRTDDIRG